MSRVRAERKPIRRTLIQADPCRLLVVEEGNEPEWLVLESVVHRPTGWVWKRTSIRRTELASAANQFPPLPRATHPAERSVANPFLHEHEPGGRY